MDELSRARSDQSSAEAHLAEIESAAQAFEEYIQAVRGFRSGQIEASTALSRQEAARLRFRGYEPLFVDTHDGEPRRHPLFGLLEEPGQIGDDDGDTDLIRSRVKLEQLLESARQRAQRARRAVQAIGQGRSADEFGQARPTTITLGWLWRRLPASAWLVLAALGSFAAAAGVYLGQLELVQRLARAVPIIGRLVE